jgi:hypothetical protein
MRIRQAQFVTGCQQLLALGAVLAVLTPAASVLNLDVVRETPGHGPARVGAATVGLSAYTREAQRPSRVPTAPVDATIKHYAMTAPAGARVRAGSLDARRTALPDGRVEVTTRAVPVTGFGGVGVTWQQGATIPEGDVSFEVRSLSNGTWSDWQSLEYHPDHAPDPNSPEGRHSLPGTDVTFVGDVDRVQVRSLGDVAPPSDMSLSVVSPGRPVASALETPAIDTATMDGANGADDALARRTGSQQTAAQRQALATYTPKPVIYSRAQWGADERLRDKSSLHYYEIHAAFVHHTVNANDYTRAEVPGILRGIYAYHTQSRGWSDIGYNFLVDRFGRIWEGRYGGVDRPVVGAHTLNYNDYAFAMSAIGNYDIKQPRDVMLQAYGTLFAWKLSLHGIDASSTKQWVGSRYFEAINGHRDAGQTACPGRYLYAKLPLIREYAAADQQGWAGRALDSDLAGDAHPDIVVRRASDGRGFILPTGGLSDFGKATVTPDFFDGTDAVVASPDLTGDGIADLVVRSTDGTVTVRPGDGQGRFGDGIRPTSAFSGYDLLTAVGDLNGDGDADLVGRNASTQAPALFLGNGRGAFDRQRLSGSWKGYDLLAGTGDLDGDGLADVLARSGDTLYRLSSTGSGFAAPVQLAGSWSDWSSITGFGDFTGDGRPDLFVKTTDGPGRVKPGLADGSFGAARGPYQRMTRISWASAGVQAMGDPLPDVIGRRGADLYAYPNAGTLDLAPRIRTNLRLADADLVLTAGDWDRDGYTDVISRTGGDLFLHRGRGGRKFAAPVKIGTGFAGERLLAAVGDMTGDGYPDLMGQPVGGSLRLYPGDGMAGLAPSYVAHSSITARSQIPVGLWDGDGAPDSIFRAGRTLRLYPGNGPGGLTSPESLGLKVGAYDWLIGVADLTSGGHPDLLARSKKTGRLYAIQATSKGFKKPRLIGEGMSVYDLAG